MPEQPNCIETGTVPSSWSFAPLLHPVCEVHARYTIHNALSPSPETDSQQHSKNRFELLTTGAGCRREVPREHLLLVIRSFGGVAAWDGEGSPFSENHESITHQVSKRSC